MSKSSIHPLREGAILLDENGRKWRVESDNGETGFGRKLLLEPDHDKCSKGRPCTHYGEVYL